MPVFLVICLGLTTVSIVVIVALCCTKGKVSAKGGEKGGHTRSDIEECTDELELNILQNF